MWQRMAYQEGLSNSKSKEEDEVAREGTPGALKARNAKRNGDGDAPEEFNTRREVYCVLQDSLSTLWHRNI